MIQRLLDTVSTSVNGSSVDTYNQGSRDTSIVQVKITATITITIQGSCDNINWVDVTSFTVTGAQAVIKFPYFRAVTSGASGSPVADAWLVS